MPHPTGQRLRSIVMDPATNSPTLGNVEIRIPASGSFVELLRGTAGRVARLAGMTYNGVEDFALAVDEVSVLLLESKPAEMTMSISRGESGGLSVTVTAVAPTEKWPPVDLESDTRWRVIGAMCERMWLLDDGRVGIGLSQSVR